MLAIERQNIIMQELETKGSILVSVMSSQLNVTEETIRRDLEALEKKNMLRRVHGGAYIVRNFVKEAPVSLRKNIYLEEKRRIADKCCELIDPYDSIMLDSSTTALYIVKKLKTENKNVTVITNSFDIIKELEDVDNIRLICIGGIMRMPSHSFTGGDALNALKGYVADKAFISSSGIHLQFGATDSIESEAHIRTAMLSNVSKRFFIADSSKFGRTAVNVVADFNMIDTVVTDECPSDDWVKKFRDCNIELIIC